jgi:hypothetical protein
MEPVLEFKEYRRIPFTIEAVEITEENLDVVAREVGEVQTKADGTRFIKVDRRLVPGVYEVFPGFFLTRMDKKIRCYSPRIFNDQYELAAPTVIDVSDALALAT